MHRHTPSNATTSTTYLDTSHSHQGDHRLLRTALPVMPSPIVPPSAKHTRKSFPSVRASTTIDPNHRLHSHGGQPPQHHQPKMMQPRSTQIAAATGAAHVSAGQQLAAPLPTADEMPAQFVAAMRTLFDIMDDQCTGLVRLRDIERRWQDNSAPGLPHGVIDSLRKVTPSSGLLSFERFCAGLKICLLRNQTGGAAKLDVTATTNKPPKSVVGKPAPMGNGVKPFVAAHSKQPKLQLRITSNTAAIRPSSRHSSGFPVVHRALSLPKLCATSTSTDRWSEPESSLPLTDSAASSPRSPTNRAGLPAPPKPPRTALVLGNGVTNINHLDQLDKAEIRHALQTWQMGVLMNEMDAKEKRHAGAEADAAHRGTADGGSTDSGSLGGVQQPRTILKSSAGGSASTTRRREPRRHTLQNGIDHNMLRQLKQFEQEKELLLTGLAAANATREWYARQLADVQDRIKLLGKTDTYLSSSAAQVHQERLQLQRVRIAQISRTLEALTDEHTTSAASSSTSTSQHMQLAVRHTSTGINPSALRQPHNAQTVSNDRLLEKNRQLSDDVLEKNQYISMLERERKTLIRELLQAQRIAGGGTNASKAERRVASQVLF